jgi:hypothetical protein
MRVVEEGDRDQQSPEPRVDSTGGESGGGGGGGIWRRTEVVLGRLGKSRFPA